MTAGCTLSSESIASAKTSISLSSSSPSIVLVTRNGITARKAGFVTITITASGNSTYKDAAKKTVYVTVKSKKQAKKDKIKNEILSEADKIFGK